MEIYFRTFKKAFKNVRRKYKRPRKLFVILNPYGGSGNASKIWNSIAKPVLELAGIRITTVRTQRPKHAYEICLDLDLELYDGLVTIGGDGILNECVRWWNSHWTDPILKDLLKLTVLMIRIVPLLPKSKHSWYPYCIYWNFYDPVGGQKGSEATGCGFEPRCSLYIP